jgi:hypothetical protein
MCTMSRPLAAEENLAITGDGALLRAAQNRATDSGFRPFTGSKSRNPATPLRLRVYSKAGELKGAAQKNAGESSDRPQQHFILTRLFANFFFPRCRLHKEYCTQAMLEFRIFVRVTTALKDFPDPCS